MELSENVVATLEELEASQSEIGFERAWRAFQRAAPALLGASLPAEARTWSEAADAYDSGLSSVEELDRVRVGAWKFHDQARATISASQIAGVRVAMSRLWPQSSRTDWYGEATAFLESCCEAGCDETALHKLLLESFAQVNRPILG